MTVAQLTTGILCMTTVLAASLSVGTAPAQEGGIRVYIGTYTGEKSKGIYLSQLNPTTGALSAAELAVETKNPSFLAIHPNRQFVYAVSEVADADNKPTGAVSAFAVEPRRDR